MSKPLQMNRPEPSVAPGVKVVKRDERARLLEAGEIIEAARARAREIERKAEEAYKERYEAGYADGLEAGRLENIEKVMETVMASVEFIEGIEGTVVDVVMQSVRKILGETSREDRIRAIVRTALANVRGQQKVTVRVAPSDEPIVSEALSGVFSYGRGGRAARTRQLHSRERPRRHQRFAFHAAQSPRARLRRKDSAVSHGIRIHRTAS